MKLDKIAGLLAFAMISVVLFGFVTATASQNPSNETIFDLETLSSDCMSERGEDVHETESFGNITRIQGVMQTPNPCHTINISEINQSEETYTMNLVAESQEEICIQCVGAVEYEIILEGDRPEEVNILHNGEEIGTVRLKRNIFQVLVGWLRSLF